MTNTVTDTSANPARDTFTDASTDASTDSFTRTQPEMADDAIPDPRPTFAEAAAIGRQIVGGVRADQLDSPTPCVDFDVRTLGRHILAVLQRLAIVGAGGTPDESPDFIEGVADDAWVEAYDRFAEQVESVWSNDAVLANILTVPWAKLPGAIALMIYINEITVHTWDLAIATGQTAPWNDGVVMTAFTAIQRGLPPEGRVDNRIPFADVVEVPTDAPLIDRLVAWNGRRP
jgi:uncharacterized protein (TIGR03086 family)